MRYNGGGLLDIVAELGYMIAGASATSGRTAFKVEFNDKHQVVDPFTDEAIKPKLFFNRVLVQSGSLGAALPSLNLSRVFVLTTIDTRSASEVLMNAQQGVDVEVIQIGGTTCGKPCGFYSTDNCGTTYSSVNFRSLNALGFGDYGDGFSPADNNPIDEVILPGCNLPEDLNHSLGDPDEELLYAALRYRLDPTYCSIRTTPASTTPTLQAHTEPTSHIESGSAHLAITHLGSSPGR